MQANSEDRGTLIISWSGAVLMTALILLSVGVGHYITARSNVPTEVHVAPAVAVNASIPKIEVHVPKQEIPAPIVEVRVPKSEPVINVQAAPATVQVITRAVEVKPEPAAEAKKEPAPVPVSVPATVAPQAEKPEPKASLDVVPTVEDLYVHAESYIESYCKQRGLDSKTERERWTVKWESSLKQAAEDNPSMDEQSYINRTVVDKRDYFDTAKATPEKVVAGCRLLLRYRDKGLDWQKDIREALTKEENIRKAVGFLQAGVR